MKRYYSGDLSAPTGAVVLGTTAYIAGGETGKVVVVGDTPAVASRNLADYGWVRSPNTGYWYKLSQAATGFDTLLTNIAPLGANAASIVSADENDFIVAQYLGQTNGFYLGARDNISEGTWYWLDGTPFTYTNWGNNQPDNAGGGEDALSMVLAPLGGDFPVAGLWNDLDDDLFALMLMQIKDTSGLTDANWAAIENEAGGAVNETDAGTGVIGAINVGAPITGIDLVAAMEQPTEFYVATNTELRRYDLMSQAVVATAETYGGWFAQATSFVATPGYGTQVSLRSRIPLTELTTYNCPFEVGHAIGDASGGVWLFEKNGTALARISLGSGSVVSTEEYPTSAANGVLTGYFRDNQLNLVCEGGQRVVRYNIADPENIVLVASEKYEKPVTISYNTTTDTEFIGERTDLPRGTTVAASSGSATVVCRVGGFIEYEVTP